MTFQLAFSVNWFDCTLGLATASSMDIVSVAKSAELELKEVVLLMHFCGLSNTFFPQYQIASNFPFGVSGVF